MLMVEHMDQVPGYEPHPKDTLKKHSLSPCLYGQVRTTSLHLR